MPFLAVRALLRFLKEGVLDTGSAEKKTPRGRRRSCSQYSLSASEIDRILEAAETLRDRVILQLLVETGIRRFEAAALKVQDVRLDERLLIIRQGKGERSRLVPITDSLCGILAKLIGAGKSGPVLKSRNGGHLSLRQFNRIVAEVGRRAGVHNPNPDRRNITCHLFRHSFARRWKKNNGSIESLSRILGHTSVKTTWDLYGTESMEDVRKNYADLMNKSQKG